MPHLRRAALASALLAATLAPALFAAGGHPKLNAYFQSTLTDAAYQQKAFARVAKAWKQPAHPPAAGKKVVVQALLDIDGKLLNAAVSMESGSKQWDAAALAAVKKAAPFDPLPKGYPQQTLEAHFHVSWEK
jgi:protein TonB